MANLVSDELSAVAGYPVWDVEQLLVMGIVLLETGWVAPFAEVKADESS